MIPDVVIVVPEEGLEPSQPRGPRDFESRASTSSATPAGWHSSPKERSLTDALELPKPRFKLLKQSWLPQCCGRMRRL